MIGCLQLDLNPDFRPAFRRRLQFKLAAKVLDTLAPYHPEIVVLDEQAQVVEGNAPGPRTIVIKFDSRDTAMAWYNCATYQKVLPLRLAATEGFGVLADGFAPPGS